MCVARNMCVHSSSVFSKLSRSPDTRSSGHSWCPGHTLVNHASGRFLTRITRVAIRISNQAIDSRSAAPKRLRYVLADDLDLGAAGAANLVQWRGRGRLSSSTPARIICESERTALKHLKQRAHR